jgi:hypothetical protein
VEAVSVNVSDIARTYRVRPQLVYTIVRDFEALGRLHIDRAGRSLILDSTAIQTIKKELERRGYIER